MEPNDPQIVPSLELKIMRGLFQVQLYACLEKTINDVIEQALRNISAKQVKNSHYILPFSVISLYNKLKSIKDSGYDKFFLKSTELFSEISNSNTVSINETMFSSTLQNVWAKTIEEVVKAFGIKGYSIPLSSRVTVDELVDKRNAVAHGRESASTIGERQRAQVLASKMTVISTVTSEIIDLFDTYCTTNGFIKPAAKKYY
ncbi:MAE_28990/MAE_18760 family HEPN-like nuclease [Hymenobacter sp. BRD67]|uniref:MAE_28990/MAE_18760 family HEPN-like nuclease n=1 Tax=Hymenobacter sp. BRD67 TaxID=2675877 RepID=UPI001564051B|nr:MAE_28990/MAE_18760 family HEPN-like nuclease [Hymenobacter sp. BRD67]QKG52128.1 hypothetical protein GKZ67_05290 [Hymenobacter sp. BRD67]